MWAVRTQQAKWESLALPLLLTSLVLDMKETKTMCGVQTFPTHTCTHAHTHTQMHTHKLTHACHFYLHLLLSLSSPNSSLPQPKHTSQGHQFQSLNPALLQAKCSSPHSI